MKCAVVIVNWNGADDTIACLRSIFDGPNDVLPLVVDNGSTDGSLERIAGALEADGVPFERRLAYACVAQVAPNTRVLLVEAGQNLGFAAGCNLGLRIAQFFDCARVCFLNNDTVVEADALDQVLRRLDTDPGCFATLPMLTVYGTDQIWNCGGTIYSLGLRRYHLAGRARMDGARRREIACSFFTGCCFAVRTAEFAGRGGFSERFFFGEEDFELALWMRERRLRAVCLTTAVVQHKVSASFVAASGPRVLSRAFVYYLNRFIHMRLRFGAWRWYLWCVAYLPYIAVLLWRSGTVRAGELPRFLWRLLARAGRQDGVTHADFEAVMAGRL
jgi:GT2 family glycosyltransferase